jgi:putative transposase
MRQSYDTSLKHLVRLGLHDAIPQQLLSAVPSSNIHRWKQETEGKYLGCQINDIAKQKLELLTQFARHRKAQTAFVAYLRLAVTFKRILRACDSAKNILYQSRVVLTDTLQRVKPVLGLKKACKFFDLSVSTAYNWLLEMKAKCSFSYLELCVRASPNQLTICEVSKIKQLVTDEQFKYWPISSIAFYALRNKILNVRLATFYKYVRLMDIKRPRFIKPVMAGLKASYPHQYWHADVTIFKVNNIKHYLYFVADNYSRFIVNWKCEMKLRGSTVRQMLAEALNTHTPHKLSLIVDGGSENNNFHINELLSENNEAIKRLIAQKDISFSNSMIEAINKIIKNNYLHLMNITSEKQLRQKLAYAIHDYNTIRPHFSLDGRTPLEVLSGIQIDRKTLARQVSQARAARIAHNRNINCKTCMKK